MEDKPSLVPGSTFVAYQLTKTRWSININLLAQSKFATQLNYTVELYQLSLYQICMCIAMTSAAPNTLPDTNANNTALFCLLFIREYLNSLEPIDGS
ncbi:hypothetical protein [Vibrio rotiferianus]|uniref:hypothetical protein n=1 Tax=Vibrio rotiferianus TaxID=190895 RepID=UPI00406A3435